VELVAGEGADPDNVTETSRKDAGSSDVLVTLGWIDIHRNDELEAFLALALLRYFSSGFKNCA
jgi:hypothetical protein